MEFYETKIIPNITKHVNKILGEITKEDKLKLYGEIDNYNNKGENLEINWYIIHNENKVMIEKASGYQQFILGIAIRIVISYIGLTNIKCKNLFVDEGFNSCDYKNIKLIKNFINNLLSIYDSVLIVSHLSEITESTNTQIKIIKKNENSCLQYGMKKTIL